MASTGSEVEVRAVIESRSEAIRLKDIERLMSVYSPDAVYFDVVPPLQYVGSAALLGRFTDWFGRWKGSIGQELQGLTIVESGDIATAHMLVRTSGTLKDGHEIAYWVRLTDGFRRSVRRWLITHEHVSFPVDMKSGRAMMDLQP